ncbi:MAG: magnesium chelatase [SAR202 cluster bacterium Io17-Chloro-G3]|nr:MAG: magnesium chelatase [SAR202 cluster bacterium Io17-Chloro-G3]
MTKRKPQDIRKLKASGYQVLPIREEMRRNLVKKLRQQEPLFSEIIGYEDTVIPQIQNALLAGQDIILLGERGQAKSRIIRAMASLLDDDIPVISGCEINDNPFDPICRSCRDRCQEFGDQVSIEWISREQRYGEKLATPDISIADLIGEVDPIRVAEGRYLSDELTIHYGLIPRTNRGIFAINELPDLAERIQVGLFNLMEERDIQIKGYRLRLPLDIFVVATANPEDYTNRGRIITPLKDRYGAHIRTHYPQSIEEEIQIFEHERSTFGEIEEIVTVPRFIKEIIAEFTALARRSPDINQRSGVSVRVSIANYETIIGNAVRRAIVNDEKRCTPRISDLPAILASTMGKIELETVEDGREPRIVDELTKKAILNVFGRYFDINEFDGLLEQFEGGLVIETGSEVPSQQYNDISVQLDGILDTISLLHIKDSPEEIAAGVEFVLEGLHLNRRLNRDKLEGRFHYRS